MRTVREYVQWTLGAAKLWGLNDGETLMGAAIAAHVNEAGECHASNERLAFFANGRHPDTARKLIRQLRRLGLVEREQRGRKRVLRLCTERLPAEQLELDLARIAATEPNGEPAAADPGHPQPGTSVPVGAQAPSVGGRSGAHQKGLEGLRSGESAREPTPPPDNDDTPVPVPPRFDEVIAILAGAKSGEVLIDDRAILSALEAHPESDGYDHLRAAHRVVAWTHDPCGGPSSASAPRLLWSVLDKQAADRARPAPDGPRTERSRGKPPKPWEGALARAFEEQHAGASA